MFFSDNLGNIDHCFFSRLGGVSLNNYKIYLKNNEIDPIVIKNKQEQVPVS